jgi:predicted DNA binding CopG/RHH family protein
MKAVQKFSDEYLERAQQMSADEIVSFVDQFRILHGSPTVAKSKSKLISLKVPEELLETFKAKAELEGVRYQTQIKKLMADWLKA